MNELTLEVLAPYLPYGLKQYQRGYGLDLITEVTPANVLNLIDGSTGYKPILRPLSDLHKPVIYRDKEIIPANYLYRKFDVTDMEFNGCITDPKHGHDVYVFLFENHFDVFGLLEKSLAIDINTLK